MAEVRAGELGRRCQEVRWEDGMIHGTIRRVREGEAERNRGKGWVGWGCVGEKSVVVLVREGGAGGGGAWRGPTPP